MPVCVCEALLTKAGHGFYHNAIKSQNATITHADELCMCITQHGNCAKCSLAAVSSAKTLACKLAGSLR